MRKKECYNSNFALFWESFDFLNSLIFNALQAHWAASFGVSQTRVSLLAGPLLAMLNQTLAACGPYATRRRQAHHLGAAGRVQARGGPAARGQRHPRIARAWLWRCKSFSTKETETLNRAATTPMMRPGC